MSMLGISFLNEIVRKKEIINPAKILYELRSAIIDALGQTADKDSQKDGMDMSLASINLETGQCLWAGAGNPIWIVRNDLIDKALPEPTEVIEVIKGDNMPVAINTKMEDYTEHELQLNKGDIIYLFSDGIIDQFGGPDGRKFMTKQLKRIVTQNVELPLDQQENKIVESLETWMSPVEGKHQDQIDDITIIGFKYET